MPRCGRNSECPHSSGANASLVSKDAVNPPPANNTGDEVTDRRIVDMERTVRELAHQNLVLKQNFNKRAHELEDINAQLQARIFELEGSRLSRHPNEEADSSMRLQDRSPRRS